MITGWTAAIVLLAVGLSFDRLIIVIAQSRQSVAVRILLVTWINNVLIFVVVAITYYMDGFTIRGEYGEGWLDWYHVISNFFWAYVITSFACMWRVIRDP